MGAAGAADGFPKGEVLLGFPTETVWGLGAPVSRAGWEALVQAKGRNPEQPFQVSCASQELALAWAAKPELLHPLGTLWPGPLTLVVQAVPDLPDFLAPSGWVGLRVPSHPVARALLHEAGGRLLTSSLNLSGQPTVRSEAEARALGIAQRVFGDGGQPPSGQASTVLRVRPEHLEFLRVGAVSTEQVRERVQGTPLAAFSLSGAGAEE